MFITIERAALSTFITIERTAIYIYYYRKDSLKCPGFSVKCMHIRAHDLKTNAWGEAYSETSLSLPLMPVNSGGTKSLLKNIRQSDFKYG